MLAGAPGRPGRRIARARCCEGVFDRYAQAMEAMDYGTAASEVLAIVSAANHYIEDTAPWALAKDPEKAGELASVIWNLLEVIRIASELYDPFMPKISAEVRRRLALDPERRATFVMPASGAAWWVASPSRRASLSSRAWSTSRNGTPAALLRSAALRFFLALVCCALLRRIAGGRLHGIGVFRLEKPILAKNVDLWRSVSRG